MYEDVVPQRFKMGPLLLLFLQYLKKIDQNQKQRVMETRYKNQKNMDILQSQNQKSSFYSSSQDYGEILQKGTKRNNIIKFQHASRETIADLVDKYFINISHEQFQMLIMCSKEFCLKHPTLKCWKELVAAILYFYYSDLLEIPNTKEFCVMNNLGSKVFNKRYKKCCMYFKQEKQLFHSLNQKVKKQQNQQIQKSSQTSQTKGKIKPHNELSTVDLLDNIFDDLFRKPQFQENRRQIIIKFAEISDNYYYPNIQSLKKIIAQDSKTVRMLYIFYYNIKKFKAKSFYFCKFKTVIQEKLNIILRKEQLSVVQKALDIYSKKVENEEEEENDMCKQEPVKGQQGQYHFY